MGRQTTKFLDADGIEKPRKPEGSVTGSRLDKLSVDAEAFFRWLSG